MYTLRGPDETTGVIRDADGLFIPYHATQGENIDWDGYLDWKALGNTPTPLTTQELADQDRDTELRDIDVIFREAFVDLFEFSLALFQLGKDKGLWTNADVDPTLRDKAVLWKQKVDRLKELGA